MAEFIGGNEKYISAREPIVFENKTKSEYEVCAGIVFHKSGIYEVSVVGNRTIVSEVPERKKGKWISVFDEDEDGCSECQATFFCAMTRFNFCPNCGADMRGE